MQRADPIDPSRIVYHRGSIIYARLRNTSPAEYRHPLDVANGLNCDCVCDECNERLVACANDLEKIAAGQYQKFPYFAHAANSQCVPSGERGLLEALRTVLEANRTIHLPRVIFRPRPNSDDLALFKTSTVVTVTGFTVEPKQSSRPPQLVVDTTGGHVRIAIFVRRTCPASFIAESKNRGEHLVAAFFEPDVAGIVYMEAVLAAVRQSHGLIWLHHPAAAAHELEQHQEFAREEVKRRTEERRTEAALLAAEAAAARVWRAPAVVGPNNAGELIAFGKPVLKQYNDPLVMTPSLAREIPLTWHPERETWVYVLTAQRSVPMHLRTMLDPSAEWLPMPSSDSAR